METNKLFVPVLVISALSFLVSCDNKSTNHDSAEGKEIAQEKNDESLRDSTGEKDADLAVAMADRGMLEVTLAEVAIRNGSSTAVKKFAEVMLTDHSKTNTELKELADKKNIALPVSLSEESLKKVMELSSKTSGDFDKAYADEMVRNHKKTVDSFRRVAERGNDSDLKNWAEAKLTTVEHHLTMAEDMERAVKNND